MMIKLFVFTRDGKVVPISYSKESQLQINAEKYPDTIFFYL